MKLFIIAVICIIFGGCFGAGIMCFMQINKGADYDTAIIITERDNNE